MSSILSTVPVYVLANHMALNCWLESPNKPVDWKLSASAAFAQRDASRPGHVFERRWARFVEEGGYDKKKCSICLLRTISLIANEYLEIQNGRLYVKDQEDEENIDFSNRTNSAYERYGKSPHFDRWQNIRARMTTLPIKLYMLHHHHCPEDYFLAHPKEPMVADFIKEEGLNETHLHLNGCCYPEEEWLYDLYAIPQFLKRETKEFKEAKIKELYASVNPQLCPSILANRMKLAKGLREAAIQMEEWWTEGHHGYATLEGMTKDMQRYLLRYSLNPSFFPAPKHTINVPMDRQARLKQEMMMWMRAFSLLEPRSAFPYKESLQSYLHLYLLMQNEHICLNYHTENRKGFEAFSVSNDHVKLSVGSPDYYKDTFYKLLKAADAKRKNIVEVRVTPKSLRENKELFVRAFKAARKRWLDEQGGKTRIQRDKFQNAQPNSQLVLVAHMIKKSLKPLNENKGYIFSDLYEPKRSQYMEEAYKLAQDARHLRMTHRIPVAIDAANSELNMPPEVFAPAYRLFEQESNISHKTYHCGEDFLHLISGIRAVYEAVTFLDLRNGNRIGHGISVGIHPREWLESMPGKLIVTRREWLLDMILVWKLLHECNPAAAAKAEREALRVAGLIFASNPKQTTPEDLQYNSIHTLSNFFEMRQFVPAHVHKWMENKLPVDSFQESEHRLLIELRNRHGSLPAKLYRYWNDNRECRLAQEESIEVKSDFLSVQELLQLQQRVQHLIAERDVVIETLPVSNLRIGQIRHIQEHHVLRWLKVKDYAVAGDADMNICMGSDDPGIFATDIKNEYYHLYMLLRNAGLSAHEAIEKLKRVNDAGRTFAFRELPDMQYTTFSLISLLNDSPRKPTLRERLEMLEERGY